MEKGRKNGRVAIVVVTYNRKVMLKECIRRLKEQSYQAERIYVIDNASSDGTEQDFSSDKEIFYYRLPTNEGGSGGFYCGIKKAYEDGYDYIWGMDDDAFPEKDSLKRIMEKVNVMPPLTCFWSNCDKDTLFTDCVKEVKDWMFVGFFLPREVIRKVGFPRKDFFIYYDDVEYSYRIRENGYHIFKVRDSVIEHKSSPENSIMKIKIGKKVINVTEVPKQKWRAYYWTRNDILRFPTFNEKKIYSIFIRFPRRLLKTLIYQPRNTIIVLKGFIHGLMGKSGKYILP